MFLLFKVFLHRIKTYFRYFIDCLLAKYFICSQTMEDVNSFGEGPDNDESKSPSSPVNISVGIVGSGANIAGGNITNITNVHEPPKSFSFQNLRQGPTAKKTQLRGTSRFIS